jgi:ketosteroid isomerase-like protein
MNEERNVTVVKETFEAFGRGDLPAVMEFVAEEAEYRSPVTRTTDTILTWARPCRGRQEVMQLFVEMGEKVAPEPFVVTNIIAQGDQVAVEGRNKGRVRSTGKRFEHDWAMIFSFKDGKIIRCYHYYDSADILSAF